MSAPHQPSSDTALSDTALSDAALSDAALSDAALSDAALSDAALSDAALSDAEALPDADSAGDDSVIDEIHFATDGAPVPGVAGSDDEGGDDGDDPLIREGDVAGDYLERLLDILDVDGDIDLDVEGDRASVAIVGGNLTTLIGPDGATLEALQELTRLAVAQDTGVRSRLMLDIGGFRARRRSDLTALAGDAARRVAQTRQPERLSPMNPFERKVVHDVIAGVSGVHSESEGEEPNRRVVVLPDR